MKVIAIYITIHYSQYHFLFYEPKWVSTIGTGGTRYSGGAPVRNRGKVGGHKAAISLWFMVLVTRVTGVFINQLYN